MHHWDEVLPGRILRVFHEDIVEDLQGSVRRMLGFCGLEFEPACVDFHKTTRAVSTANRNRFAGTSVATDCFNGGTTGPDAPLRYRDP
ncbi:MAG: hypothetical protein QOF42_2260 [Gammaproteobacteria bacterium]|jgi:hypothetical protein|nr:hypothetical protein [Gammaproteobacteria bacterium]